MKLKTRVQLKILFVKNLMLNDKIEEKIRNKKTN
jgi:hypothetical protein